MSLPSFELPEILQMPDLPAHLHAVSLQLQKIALEAGPTLAKPATRIVQTPGKMLRAALVLAVAQATEEVVTPRAMALATAVELTHLGSLVHDDIIDHATIRRGYPSVNAYEGRDLALLLGDYFLARACGQAAKVDSGASARIAQIIAELCAGEALELDWRYKMYISREVVGQIVDHKTASLMAVACQLGVQPLAQQAVYAKFGRHFGRAFQLIDDVLDFISTPGILGKPCGNDTREGLYTMPVIIALQGPHRQQLKRLLAQKTTADVAKVTTIIETSQAFTKTIQLALDEAQIARQLLQHQAPALAALPFTYINYAQDHLAARQYKTIWPQ
jgi:heptaprenyl diphosphate synthase